VARISGHYHFKPRHRINFDYFNISNDATTTLLRDIQFEDTIEDRDEPDWDYDGFFGYARFSF